MHRFRIVSAQSIRCEECGHEEEFNAAPYNCVKKSVRTHYKQIRNEKGQRMARHVYAKALIATVRDYGWEHWHTVGRTTAFDNRKVNVASAHQKDLLHARMTMG